MPNLILIHGPMGVGKSTTVKALLPHLDNYIFIDRAYIKQLFAPLGRAKAKELTRPIIELLFKEAMAANANIITQEIAPAWGKKSVFPNYKEQNYTLYSFFLHCPKELAQQREAIRQKDRGKIARSDILDEVWDKYPEQAPEDIMVDTEHRTTEEIVQKILNHFTPQPF